MVAIDRSPDSFKAAEYAIELAKVYGAQLCAVTVTYESKEKRDDMNDAKRWFQDLDHEPKEKNIQLKTKLINRHAPWPLIPVPPEYVLLEYAEKGLNRSRNKRTFGF